MLIAISGVGHVRARGAVGLTRRLAGHRGTRLVRVSRRILVPAVVRRRRSAVLGLRRGVVTVLLVLAVGRSTVPSRTAGRPRRLPRALWGVRRMASVRLWGPVRVWIGVCVGNRGRAHRRIMRALRVCGVR